jgi:hypothetical protein
LTTPTFYTLPDNGIQHSFFLVNRKNYHTLFKRNFKHAIIDSGVMDFVHGNVTEYPASFLHSWSDKAIQLNEALKGKAWFVIPDYPDDYNPGQFGDNVAKTLMNVERFLKESPSVNWLPVIQSRYQDRFSFLESAKQLHDLIGDYPQVAIGTVCKCRNLAFIIYCCRVARKQFPKSWIHAFGLTLKALPKVSNLINSFDSMAWTFPREHGGHSCKNQKERVTYFHAYIKRIQEITA